MPAYSLLFLGLAGPLTAAPVPTLTRPHCVIAAPYQDEGAADYQPPTPDSDDGPPADLYPTFKIEVEQVVLPIRIDLAERRGQPTVPGLIEEVFAGFVTVDHGVVYFNDRPLAAPHAGIAFCQ